MRTGYMYKYVVQDNTGLYNTLLSTDELQEAIKEVSLGEFPGCVRVLVNNGKMVAGSPSYDVVNGQIFLDRNSQY